VSDRLQALFPVRLRNRTGWAIFLSAAALLVGAATLLFWWHGQGHTPAPPSPPAVVVDDPRLTYATPYRNVRPEVQYVGDATCALCHPTQADTYRHHPMGRSLAPIARVADEHRYDKAAGNPFVAFGLEFFVDRRGDRVFHRQVRRDARGQMLSEVEEEVLYGIGSNTRGRSFLAVHDNFVFQTSISWFTQGNSWDLAPGWREHQLAGRPVLPSCLYCHTNQVEPVPHTLNHYRPPLFRGYSIGCERCHGPGELHVARRERGEVVQGVDDTIVNPRDLEPALRESICQQCHLEGEKRILRRNRGVFDFRPGLPLHLFWSVFVKSAEVTHDYEAVSHVEQMYQSRCFQASRGKMGCISCHDPHVAPSPEKKVVHYRDHCLKCHAVASCGLPEPARRKQHPDDSCIACHMPRMRSADIAHTAVTDHRVLRVPEASNSKKREPMRLPPGKSPIEHFHRDLIPPNDPGVARDLGLALMELGQQFPPAQRQMARLARSHLEEAVQAVPDDAQAGVAYGTALWNTGQPQDGLAVVEAVLERVPEHENALQTAATMTDALRRPAAALAYSRRLLQVNPHYQLYHLAHANRLVENQLWGEALQSCQVALRLNPADLKARRLLVLICARSGDKDRARKEFDTFMAFTPPEPDALRAWFAGLMR
jgi:Flp pilus assembly protein TadD